MRVKMRDAKHRQNEEKRKRCKGEEMSLFKGTSFKGLKHKGKIRIHEMFTRFYVVLFFKCMRIIF